MTSLLVRTNLSRGDLRLYLSNDNGYASDAASVRWTVFDPSGCQVSGRSIPAIRAACGEYYAPWFSDVRNGNYTLRWDIQETAASAPRSVDSPFFVVDPSSYQPAGAVQKDGVPIPGGRAYLSGATLGPGDLPLYLKDSNGVLTDALAVFWTICDSSGNPISPRNAGYRIGVGCYYAPWWTNVASGDYSVLWEYMQDASSPMQSVRMGFSVVNPLAPIFAQLSSLDPCLCPDQSSPSCTTSGSQVVIPASVLANCSPPTSVPCGASITISAPCPQPTFVSAPLPVNASCGGDDSIEIPRVVHLAPGILPPSGGFTAQPVFNVPHGIRHVAFYITYTRGAPNGNALFKLMWGNGVEESQETIVDTDIAGPSIMGQQGMFLQDLTGPVPADDNPISFVLYVSVPGGAKTVRLLASEAGVPGIPGIVGITLTASSN